MSAKAKKVTTPVGFVEVSITVGKNIPVDKIGFLRSGVKFRRPETPRIDTIAVPIGEPLLIPLRHRIYEMWAFFGEISSDHINVDVLPGEIVKLHFHFGKEEE